ncbi:MAG: efflux RND transporter periplasmic adaptor subunit [Lentisphaerae bacterium]|nr:efflux RND transporter periplasmic adaptor subunit [Lentisphaerota bacterium]
MNQGKWTIAGGFTTLLAVLLLATGCGKEAGQPQHKSNAHDGNAKVGGPSADSTETLCTAHSVSRDLCFICNPALREPLRLWCKEHNRYEDRCWECHPDAQDKNRLFCKEHSLYEDECWLCRPDLKRPPNTAASTGVQAAPLMCPEHGVPEAECGICHPELVSKLLPGQAVKVRLPSAESAGLAGVQIAAPTLATIADGIECYAEIAFNQNKLAQIVTPVSGIIQEVMADLGDKVAEKQTVAKIWSAAIAESVAKAVLSHQMLNRERKLWANRITSEQALQQAEAEHRAACQQLSTLGFTEEQVDVFGAKPHESVMLEVRAPFAGEIVERSAVRGAFIETGKLLFTLADRSVMWAMLNIPESALARIEVLQTVELQVDSLPGRAFTGKLTWIGAEVDEHSRMARARAEMPNPDGLLKANMFAQARILTRSAEGALLLPPSAIQRVEDKPFIFVKLADDLFEARVVRLGAKFDGQVEIMEGLQPQEAVAVKHSFALKSAFLISRLGAGCADE